MQKLILKFLRMHRLNLIRQVPRARLTGHLRDVVRGDVRGDVIAARCWGCLVVEEIDVEVADVLRGLDGGAVALEDATVPGETAAGVAGELGQAAFLIGGLESIGGFYALVQGDFLFAGGDGGGVENVLGSASLAI